MLKAPFAVQLCGPAKLTSVDKLATFFLLLISKSLSAISLCLSELKKGRVIGLVFSMSDCCPLASLSVNCRLVHTII